MKIINLLLIKHIFCFHHHSFGNICANNGSQAKWRVLIQVMTETSRFSLLVISLYIYVKFVYYSNSKKRRKGYNQSYPIRENCDIQYLLNFTFSPFRLRLANNSQTAFISLYYLPDYFYGFT
jgi:hypothetical protein